MIKIDGIIVVEGRDDKTALSRVIEGNIFVLHGMTGANKKKIDQIYELSKKNTIYLLLDPDFAGNKIRKSINMKVKNAINIYANREKATKNGNVGIENMLDEDIKEMFLNIRQIEAKKDYVFTTNDLVENNLTAHFESKKRREVLGELLNISYSNSKGLLAKLNALNITKKEFDENIEVLDLIIKYKDKEGVVFGKFNPLHYGHVNFIKKVSRYVKKLYIFVCEETKRDKKLFEDSKWTKFIPLDDRVNCLKTEIRGYKNIEVLTLNEDGIKAYPNGWENWSLRVKEAFLRYGIRPEVVFTNEVQDTKNYDTYLNLETYMIDQNREKFNVSSTKLRNDPLKYIEYIPEGVRKFI